MNISIEQLAQELPDFASHEEARNWFQQKYKDSFIYKSQDVSDGMNVFFYHIVKDPQVYEQYMAELQNEVHSTLQDDKAFYSYTTVEIAENGDISLSL